MLLSSFFHADPCANMCDGIIAVILLLLRAHFDRAPSERADNSTRVNYASLSFRKWDPRSRARLHERASEQKERKTCKIGGKTTPRAPLLISMEFANVRSRLTRSFQPHSSTSPTMNRTRSPIVTRSQTKMDCPVALKCHRRGSKTVKELIASAKARAAAAAAENEYAVCRTRHPSHPLGPNICMRTETTPPPPASEPAAIRQPRTMKSCPQRRVCIQSPIQFLKQKIAARISEEINAAKELKKNV
uniref:Uncharacterized protein n=1 Tax=Panagrellus redivivus TaxID=6233 RepID=A0A7E4WA88_PANRE